MEIKIIKGKVMFVIFCILFCVIVFCEIIVVINKSDDLGGINWVSSYKQGEYKENPYKKINENTLNHLEKINFNISKIYYLNDNFKFDKSSTFRKFIIIDNVAKKVCFTNYENGEIAIVDFNDILNYEIYENGTNKTMASGLGGVGFIGGMLWVETKGNCKDLRLIIRINRLENPHIAYSIISDTPLNRGINKSSKKYSKCIYTLQEVVSFLEVLLNENKKRVEN